MKILKSKRYNKFRSFRNKGGSSEKCLYNPESKLYEKKCPGLKYFKEIKDNLERDPNAVYIVFGHGCDLYEEVLQVPISCKYYTTTSCGLTTNHNPKITEDFFNEKLDLKNTDKYFIQTGYENLDGSLAEYKDVTLNRVEGLYEHNEGESYVNNKNWSFLKMGSFAGLRKMGDMKIYNQKLSSFMEDKDKQIKKQQYTLEIYYLQHFAGSIFPTTFQVCKLLHENFTENELNNFEYSLYRGHDKFIKLIINNFSIDFASIMENLPGKFINSACRPICEGPDSNDVLVLDQPENDESWSTKRNKFIHARRRDSVSDYPRYIWTD
jgi:hypothetical protein